MDPLKNLKEALERIPQCPYPVHSRIHPLRTFGKGVFIKRDDELSFGISGTKLRKYRTLLPYIVQKQPAEVLVIGGAYSNNVLGLTQLLLENGLKPVLFLRESHQTSPRGNLLWVQMLVPPKQIHWVSRAEWLQVDRIAHAYAANHANTMIIPEGSCLLEALPGAMTLAVDIVKNEEENRIVFDHIFIEAGTGAAAIALLLGLAWLEKPAMVHVVLLADKPQIFLERLEFFRRALAQQLGMYCPEPKNFVLSTPVTARSFGAVNNKVLQEIMTFARAEGIFLDPIYSAKLMMMGRASLEAGKAQGTVLFIHSGGAYTLSGFQEALLNQIQERW